MKCVMNLAMSLQRREVLSSPSRVHSLLKHCNKLPGPHTHFIPLRCMIHSTMVAFTQNRMKKSTVSARNLCRGEGMVYSCPEDTKRGAQGLESFSFSHQIIQMSLNFQNC